MPCTCNPLQQGWNPKLRTAFVWSVPFCLMLTNGSCAIEVREPCQVGNQAALSGIFDVLQECLFRVRRTVNAHNRFSILWCMVLFCSLLFILEDITVYKALYRKYRPQTFEEVCGRDEIISILKNQIKTGKLAHAYLFCGTRGTGKTTCAKILAKAVNCLSPIDGNPCGECEACRIMESGLNTDIVEMDAASNNGVGDVRELIDELVYTPTELKKRVYIIDEVHMMSQSAFNALLKTLEEPPEHVIFILATTELNKLPSTIISRCQRYDFDRLSNMTITNRLRFVADSENISIDDEALFVIAKLAQGGLRDALVYLELCMGVDGNITAEKASRLFGVTSYEQFADLTSGIAQGDISKIFTVIGDVYKGSSDLAVFWADLIAFYRDMLVCKTVKNYTKYIEATPAQAAMLAKTAEKYTKEKILYHIEVMNEALYLMQKNPTVKRTAAEMALVRLSQMRLDSSPAALNARISELESKYSMLRYTPTAATEIFLDENTENAVDDQHDEQPDRSAETEHTEKVSTVDESKTMVTLRCWNDICERLKIANPASRLYLTDSMAYTCEGKLYVFFGSAIAIETAKQNLTSIISEINLATDGKYSAPSAVIFKQKTNEENEKYTFIDEIEEN